MNVLVFTCIEVPLVNVLVFTCIEVPLVNMLVFTHVATSKSLASLIINALM